jgi:Ca2+-binding EF-hand superfamily protein
VVNYYRFCADVDEIFSSEEQQDSMKSMMMTSSPGSTVMSTFRPNSVEDEDRFMHVLHRVATLCKARGVAIKPLYLDLDRAPIPNPSMQNPRRGGKVTRSQFIRTWPFKREMSSDDLELICDRYATKGGDVHFMALHNEVSEVMGDPAQPFPTSPLHLRPDGTKWSHSDLPVVRKIMSKVVEKRCRLKEHFQDFDPLRKGFCTPGQVKTVITIMGLSRDIDRTDFETVLSLYMGDDGLFDYRSFCDDIDIAFTAPNLERDPLARIELPDASTTAPARRNTMRLSDAKLSKGKHVEDKVRTFVRKRRLNMKPMFQDFDRAERGYVSRNQFARIMSMVQFELDEKAIDLLAGIYCDYGNHNDFNWKAFLRAVDPPAQDVEVAMMQMTSPFIAFKPRPYFNDRGRIIPRSSSMPSIWKVD